MAVIEAFAVQPPNCATTGAWAGQLGVARRRSGPRADPFATGTTWTREARFTMLAEGQGLMRTL